MRLVVLLLVFALIPARTDANLRMLRWLNSSGLVSDQGPDCHALPDSTVLVAGFRAPPGLGRVERIEAMVDYCTEPNPLLPFWRFDPGAECRPNGFFADATFPGAPSSIRDPWGGGAETVTTWTPFFDGTLTHARIHVVVTPHPDSTVILDTSLDYYACRIVFRNRDADCGGCSLPACFILNQLAIVHANGTYYFEDYSDSRYARWQEGQPDCPFIVPVHPTTWSAIKARVR